MKYRQSMWFVAAMLGGFLYGSFAEGQNYRDKLLEEELRTARFLHRNLIKDERLIRARRAIEESRLNGLTSLSNGGISSNDQRMFKQSLLKTPLSRVQIEMLTEHVPVIDADQFILRSSLGVVADTGVLKDAPLGLSVAVGRTKLRKSWTSLIDRFRELLDELTSNGLARHDTVLECYGMYRDLEPLLVHYVKKLPLTQKQHAMAYLRPASYA